MGDSLDQKRTQINLRLSPEQLRLYRQAAEACARPVSTWMKWVLDDAASKDVHRTMLGIARKRLEDRALRREAGKKTFKPDWK